MNFFAVLLALLCEQLKPLRHGNRVHQSVIGWVRWTGRNFDAGDEHHAAVVWAITVLVPGLAVALIPPMGIWGAVAANVGGSLTSLLLLARSELRGLGVTARQAVRDALPCFVGAALAGLLLLATDVVAADAWVLAVAAAGVGGVLYLVLLRVTHSGLTPADSEAVTRGIPGPARRVGALVLGGLTARPEDRAPL